MATYCPIRARHRSASAAVAEDALTFKIPAAAGAPMLVAGPSPTEGEEERPSSRAGACSYELAHPHERTVWRATGNEEPVFLDRTGRRQPLLRAAGAAAGLAAAGWLAALVTGAIGFSTLPGVTAPAAGGLAPVAQRPARVVVATVRPHRRLAVDVGRPHRRDVDRASGPRAIRV